MKGQSASAHSFRTLVKLSPDSAERILSMRLEHLEQKFLIPVRRTRDMLMAAAVYNVTEETIASNTRNRFTRWFGRHFFRYQRWEYRERFNRFPGAAKAVFARYGGAYARIFLAAVDEFDNFVGTFFIREYWRGMLFQGAYRAARLIVYCLAAIAAYMTSTGETLLRSKLKVGALDSFLFCFILSLIIVEPVLSALMKWLYRPILRRNHFRLLRMERNCALEYQKFPADLIELAKR